MRDVFINIYIAGKMHSNQTGCFPATSSKGNQYIMVLVEVASEEQIWDLDTINYIE